MIDKRMIGRKSIANEITYRKGVLRFRLRSKVSAPEVIKLKNVILNIFFYQ